MYFLTIIKTWSTRIAVTGLVKSIKIVGNIYVLKNVALLPPEKQIQMVFTYVACLALKSLTVEYITAQ
jgi:hypothetical protein